MKITAGTHAEPPDKHASNMAPTADAEPSDAETDDVAPASSAEPTDHHAFDVTSAADTESPHADAGKILPAPGAEPSHDDASHRLPGTYAEEADAKSGDFARAGCRKADRQPSDTPLHGLDWLPQGEIEAVYLFEIPIAKVEPDAVHTPRIADAETVAVDRQVKALRMCCGRAGYQYEEREDAQRRRD
jgi:hypothetical protein